MKKYSIVLLLIFMKIATSFANDVARDDLRYSTSAIFINAQNAGLQSIGLNKTIIDEFIQNNYSKEDAFLSKSFNQNIREHIYIAPISSAVYMIIFYSSLNCGTIGCHGKIYSKDNNQLNYIKDTDNTFDCTAMENVDNMYVCSSTK